MQHSKVSVYCTWPFYVALLLLLFNDFVLKQMFANGLTGKLSDFSGVFLLVLMLRALAPKYQHQISISVIVFFSLWKSPYAQPMIEFFNHYSYFSIGRVVDLSDLMALLMIPLAHKVFMHRHQLEINVMPYIKIPAMLMASFALMATSVIMPYDQYFIQKASEEQSIERAKAVAIIKKVANAQQLICVQCDSHGDQGEFQNNEISLKYAFLKHDRGVFFEIAGSATIFGSSREAMNVLKSALQQQLSEDFQDMEFIVQLPKRINVNGRLTQ